MAASDSWEKYICSGWCLECKTGVKYASLIVSSVQDIDGASKLVLLSGLHSHEYINWKLTFPSKICLSHITFVAVSVQSIYSKLIIGNFSIKDKPQKGNVSISLYKCACLPSTGVLLKLLVAGQGNIYWDTESPDLNCNAVLQWAINSLLVFFLNLKKNPNPQLWNVLTRFLLEFW